jgi:DNA-binding GntR family transcriptional regulator
MYQLLRQMSRTKPLLSIPFDARELTATATDATAAYSKLREMILRSELRPGEDLVERALMQRLGVGRTPLRDALHLLAHEGLVDIMPRRGTRVSQVTLSDLQHVFELRAGIERLVARFAVARATEADIERIADLAARARASPDSDVDQKLDTRFHIMLLDIAGNRYLTETYRRLFDASLRLLSLTRCGLEPKVDQIQTLEQTERALRERDADGLGDVLVDHVRAFRERVRASIFETAAVRLEPSDIATGEVADR